MSSNCRLARNDHLTGSSPVDNDLLTGYSKRVDSNIDISPVLCCVHLYTDGNRVTTLSFVVRRAVISIVHMYLLILYDRLATVAGLYCDVCY